MSFVQEVDVRALQVKQSILALQRDAFGSFPEETYDHILLDSPQPPVGYGVYEDGDLVAFNGFVGHAVQRKGEVGVAYQSCMSATRKDQKGKGHFSKIIDFAKQDLRLRGGKFIFGFPNHNSGPIFVKKLEFTISENVPCVFMARGPFRIGGVDQDLLQRKLGENPIVSFDAYETAKWKAGRKDGRFFEYENLTNYLFGKVVRKQVKGVSFNLLVVGGMEINKPMRWNAFMTTALKKSGALVARMNVNKAVPLALASKFRRAETLTEPTIAYGLDWDVQAAEIDAFVGLKDVY